MLRRRRIYLERSLLRNPLELRRILIHELFHFVWLRLGNALRRRWELLLRDEILAGARGELGHSAECRKDALERSALRTRSNPWRRYVCESFCDSAAWWFLRPARHQEFTLPRRWRARRARWLARLMERPALPL